MAGVARKPAKRRLRAAKQARSKATVDSIIEAAAQILAKQGWRGLNTNAIAALAGVSIGSVYEYFANKKSIVDRIIAEHLDRGEAVLEAGASALKGNEEPNEIVHLLVSGFVGVHQDNPQLHKALSTEVPLDAKQRNRIQAFRQRAIDIVSSALRAHVDEHDLKAALLVDAADALAHRWIIDELGAPVSADKMAKELEKMLTLYVSS